MSTIRFSTPQELERIASIVTSFQRLPFVGANIPGAVCEAIVAHVRGGEVLSTYDFIDIINASEGAGWQVKSTKSSTPVTWKRAKIPNALALIEASQKKTDACQVLGNAIIQFCNAHVEASIKDYGLTTIGYSRLIMHNGGEATYFERKLCTAADPRVFKADEFAWRWSKPKNTTKKEQLPALHGIHLPSGQKWWAWHGLGENQLHFSGERAWWPQVGHPNRIDFKLDRTKYQIDEIIRLLASLAN